MKLTFWWKCYFYFKKWHEFPSMKKFVIIFFLTNISNLKYLEAAMFLIFANYRSSHRRSYIKKSFLKILKTLHVNNCDDLGLQIYTLFFIRASKFCLRLAVLIFFYFWSWNVLNLFLFPRLNPATPQRRMSDWVQ